MSAEQDLQESVASTAGRTLLKSEAAVSTPPSDEATRAANALTELNAHARQALTDVGFAKPDSDTITIVTIAARFKPEGDEQAITTARLLAGGAAIGEVAGNPRSYPAALAKVLRGDTSFARLSERYQLFHVETESTDVALKRLGTQ